LKCDVAVIGSGMGALSAAALLAKDGLNVQVFEQNYLPGGCTSSYWRKGFVFEAGATTLVGLDQGMPLQYLCEQLGIHLPVWPLELPMRVYMPETGWIEKYKNIEEWIKEAERVFGVKNQRAFWTLCHRISQFVWQASLKQLHFPPGNLSDMVQCIRHVDIQQLLNARWSLLSVEDMLRRFDLDKNHLFVRFVQEQLMITAQNTPTEVNMLFGATALCYTQFGNYYMPGGLMGMVEPFVQYIQAKGGAVHLRKAVQSVDYQKGSYHLSLAKGETCSSTFLISGIPINNLQEIALFPALKKLQSQTMASEQLNSAFQIGIAYAPKVPTSIHPSHCLHYQIHVPEGIPHLHSGSYFVSLSHPDDNTRSDKPGHIVASVSTHVSNPAAKQDWDKEQTKDAILDHMAKLGFFEQEDIVYSHSSTPSSWAKWTGRKWGFVGGYPQYRNIKPWQMVESRLQKKGIYLVGDTVYPGQGIPGVTLGGIIAYTKLSRDLA
jgi:C-3',4' desaturase CrtD